MNVMKKDITFGDMTYNHSWYKETSVRLFDKEFLVDIIARAYKGEDIINSQREMFSYAMANIETIWETAIPLIYKYITGMDKFDSSFAKDYVYKNIAPFSFLFQRDNSWGILCNTNKDEDSGVAVVIKDGNITICTIEEFL